MPVFEYKAYDEAGDMRGGIVDADTPAAARLKLRGDRVHVFEITEMVDGKIQSSGEKKYKLKRKHVGELAIVTRQFATLLDAGITVVDALQALIDQVESREIEHCFRVVREKVTQGQTLGEAMAMQPGFFSSLYVNMIKAGEASGNLDTVMKRLADYLQKQNRVRNKVMGAMMYPIVMSIVGVLVVSILLTVVVPKIQDIFREQDKALPTLTVALISLSEFLQAWWWMILLSIAVLIMIWKFWVATEKGRFRWDLLMLKLPVFGMLMRKQAIARFATTMATLLKSGLPVLNALQIVENVIQSKPLAKAVGSIHDSIVEGSDIASPLKETGVFPPMVGYMIATGEQSGQLEDILFKVSEAYDEEVDNATAKMTSVLEPLIIVCLAVVIGFIVLAIVQPLLQMSGLG